MSTAKAPSMTDSNSRLIEGRDYYWEGAVIVFTARYLLNRGYCCENGCRHCPYRPMKSSDQSSIRVKEE